MSLFTRVSLKSIRARLLSPPQRFLTTDATGKKVKVLVVGGGTGGLTAANQIYNKFKREGKSLADGDITILDKADCHYYQPGWTLVGAGLKDKKSKQLRQPLSSIIPKHFTHISEDVASFTPKSSTVTTTTGRSISYDVLVVAAGIQINWDKISGLSAALADPASGVSSIYSYSTCDKTWQDIEGMRSGKAVFTQPAGPVKCAGAPQKIMWLAWDHFRKSKKINNIQVEFWTGMPTMFSVPKYSEVLNSLRNDRGVRGEFSHDLISVNSATRTAIFKKPDGSTVQTDYSLLHVTPPMGPPNFIKESPLADSVGWVNVDDATLQHKNPEYSNVFALGDCSSLPTSKTAAAISAQAPVLTENIYSFLHTGQVSGAAYDGYTSCPLLTSYDTLLLAEFMYGGKPKETFNNLFGIDQGKPRRIFFHLKTTLFPLVYFDYFVTGRWFGPRGFSRPY